MDLDQLGTWDGDKFTFTEPLQLGTRIVKSLDFSIIELAPGIEREDVIHALANPIHIEEDS